MLKKFIVALLLAVFVVPINAPFVVRVFAQQKKPAPKKMNVLFIAVDDLNVALSAYGNRQVISPNIDRLAQRSVRFDRAYAQYPLCNPSRSSLFSGYRPEVTRVMGNFTPPRTTIGDVTLLPEYFRQNGYFTARQGKMLHALYENAAKWDIAQPEQRVMNNREKTVSTESQPAASSVADGQTMSNQNKTRADGKPLTDAQAQKRAERQAQRKAERQAKKKAGNADPKTDSDAGEEAQEANPKAAGDGGEAEKMKWGPLDVAPEETPDGRSITRAIENINQAVKENKPFFVGAGFTKPHLAWKVPRKYFDMYDVSKIELSPMNADDRKNKPALAFTTTAGTEQYTDADRREAVRAYYACVSFVDDEVGKLLKTMDDNKLWDNTIVVLWGDHGFHLGDHGLWRKMTLFERGTHVPLMIAAPGIKGGATSPRVVELLDLYPTLAELAGLPVPADQQGKSIVPLLKNPKRVWNSAAYTVVERGKILGRSVRDERYRYTEWDENGSQGAELYDYDTDPNEFNNLVQNPKFANIVKKMKEMLHKQQEKDATILRAKFVKS